MDFFIEYAHIVYNKALSVFLTHINWLLDFTSGHGKFAVAVALLMSIALFVFAMKSLKVYRVALPLAAVVFGSWAAARICPRILNYFFPSMVEYVDPAYAAGIVAAVILAFFCIKYYKFATLCLGAGFGYVVVLRFAEKFFETSDIFRVIVDISSPRVVSVFYTVLAHLCMLVTIFIVYKWFKEIYLLWSTTTGVAASFGVITFLAFKVTDFTVKATLVACAIGALVGLIFFFKQLKENKDQFHYPECRHCEKIKKAKAAKAAKAAKEADKKAKAEAKKAKAAKASKKEKKAAKAAA